MYWPTRAAKAEHKSPVLAHPGTTNQPKMGLFQMYSLSPYLPQFQQSAKATLRGTEGKLKKR
jgi:hypothetical protein